MSTLEMWPDVMYLLEDTVAEGEAPSRGASPLMAAYAIVWVLLSNFFLMQLFVGVTLETFNEIRSEQDGSGLLTAEQRAYCHILLNSVSLQVRNRPACIPASARAAPDSASPARTQPAKPVQPPGRLRGRGADDAALTESPANNHSCIREDSPREQPARGYGDERVRWAVDEVRRRAFLLVTSRVFELAIGMLLVLSMAVMAHTWYGQPDSVESFNTAANYFFLAAFTSEMVLKLLGLGSRQYFDSRWNVFDFTIVTSWLTTEMLRILLGSNVPTWVLMMLR